MKKFFLLLIVLISVGCSNVEGEYKMISGNVAKNMVNEGAIIMDVRTTTEYDLEHIDGAINIPLDKIDRNSLENAIESYDTNIILYCRSGARSKAATDILLELGYQNVYDLGSIDNWDK